MRIHLAFTLCLWPAAVQANQQCFNATVASSAPSWNQNVTLLRFDPNLGTLNSITYSVTSTLTGSCGVESLDAAPLQVQLVPAVQVSLHRPNNSVLVSVTPSVTFVDNLTAYDGTLDFAGTSGMTHSGINLTALNSGVDMPGDLALFTGPAGNPGGITLSVQGVDASTATAPSNPATQFTVQAGALVFVCYDYTPTPYSFCFGDGSGTACPCGNTSAVGAGQGCRNSTGVGARLTASGQMSVTNDTLVLSCNGLPGTTNVLFFQGTIQAGGGPGTPFGDGLRCVMGTVIRLHVETASGGVATYPHAGELPVSVAGSAPPNLSRLYQVWYRNAAAFCTTATFNLSQGLSVPWQP
jgi:hypothetical protein